mmetsp:Transcript_92802/g.193976  ORF Transcript_92802/g.193976 Transcript_92802/m.193976 type:complete len:259 (+) Transcript_92802:376-1152(+)
MSPIEVEGETWTNLNDFASFVGCICKNTPFVKFRLPKLYTTRHGSRSPGSTGRCQGFCKSLWWFAALKVRCEACEVDGLTLLSPEGSLVLQYQLLINIDAPRGIDVHVTTHRNEFAVKVRDRLPIHLDILQLNGLLVQHPVSQWQVVLNATELCKSAVIIRNSSLNEVHAQREGCKAGLRIHLHQRAHFDKFSLFKWSRGEDPPVPLLKLFARLLPASFQDRVFKLEAALRPVLLALWEWNPSRLQTPKCVQASGRVR